MIKIIDNGYAKFFQMIEFRSTNPKLKAFVSIGRTLAGRYYLQFHEASGLLCSYVRQSGDHIGTEDGLIMPKYAIALVKAANHYIDTLFGNPTVYARRSA